MTGLSPVIITVRMPIWRSSSKRSLMPPLTMSFRWTTPSTQLSWATTSGVPPDCGDALHELVELGGRAPPFSATNRLTASAAPLRRLRPSRSTPLMRVEAENGMNCVLAELLLAEPEPLLGEDDDRASLGRLVGERGELGDLGELELLDAVDRQELGRLAVAERDRAGLVEQEHVDVARGLDRAARHRQHVALDEPVHAGDADRREQRADRRRDERDEKRDQDGLRELRCRRRCANGRSVTSAARNVIVRPARRMLSAISFGRLPALRALDERDHAVEERLARLLRHLDRRAGPRAAACRR